MDVDDGLRVQKVVPHSPAAQAGIEPGDDLLTLNGQPLLSQADIQWVLHKVPAETRLAVTLTRDGKKREQTLALRGPWKETDLSWRASSGPGLRYGLWTVALPEADRKRRDLPAEAMALQVKNLFAPRAEPLRKAGLRVGDVIVAVDGKTALRTETQFLVHIRLNHPPGDRVKLTILRGRERHELELPMW
jgi:S1-C subfamily serine protease